MSSIKPIALDWSARKAAAPLSLCVFSVIASVSPVRSAPHRLSKRKRGTASPAAAAIAPIASRTLKADTVRFCLPAAKVVALPCVPPHRDDRVI